MNLSPRYQVHLGLNQQLQKNLRVALLVVTLHNKILFHSSRNAKLAVKSLG